MALRVPVHKNEILVKITKLAAKAKRKSKICTAAGLEILVDRTNVNKELSIPHVQSIQLSFRAIISCDGGHASVTPCRHLLE